MQQSNSQHIFYRVEEKVDFPSNETKVLHYWGPEKPENAKQTEEKNDNNGFPTNCIKKGAFETSLEQSKNKPEYSFYDGPPFATGLPHYGHILAGTIKDIVTRYYHQCGYHIVRRFGWDCHGLPIEFEIDKKLGIKERNDIIKYGIDKYNEECRSIVMKYSSEWRQMVTRMGRWIDFDNDYKTMNTSFMESVWYIFQQLYKKKLVYSGFKVMPFSWACSTPLSNFEANLNYQDVVDPAIIVSFPVKNKDFSLLAWTTTPWTLPSNLALCVNLKMKYLKIKDKPSGNYWVVAESRLPFLYPSKKSEEKKQKLDYEVVETFAGSDLVGLRYEPLFNYFYEKVGETSYRVLSDDYVSEDSGTGIVHQAPGFGEDDYRVCLENGVFTKDGYLVCPVDDDGRFTTDVKDWSGRNVKECDNEIIRHLKEKKRLISRSTITHNYPFCWRSKKPLIYKAVPSYFVSVTSITDRLLENNKKTYWVPAFVKERRFHNWLKDAQDWAISRNRFWGTPIPLWKSDDGEEVVVIGSVEELQKLSGVSNISDLHRHFIDKITIPSKRGPKFGTLKRIDGVFDCWFESGSMPYAQLHYPFENKEYFERSFPADFIAEGLDQTRGWFYTLLVLSTALFDKPAFKNLIVNGLVLAKDGKKMSKSEKNYPDPKTAIIDKYGADALRIYLINSPVVRAEPLKFNEIGVKDVVKEVFLPWYNTYRFFVEQCRRKGRTFKRIPIPDIHKNKHTGIMDKWIIACLQSLIEFVRNEMKLYRLYTVIPRLLTFIDQLSRWYVRFNKSRLKGDESDEDCMISLATLFEVLYSLCILMGPFTPFIVEYMYQNLKNGVDPKERQDSVHYLPMLEPNTDSFDPDIERKMSNLQRVIEVGRIGRTRAKIPFRQPLRSITIVHEEKQFHDDLKSLLSYVEDQLNVKTIKLCDISNVNVIHTAEPERKKLGPRLQNSAKSVFSKIKEMNSELIKECKNKGFINIDGFDIKSDEIIFGWKFIGDVGKMHIEPDKQDLLLMIDTEIDNKLTSEFGARGFIRSVQNMRKKAGITPEDAIDVFIRFQSKESPLYKIIQENGDLISSTLHLQPKIVEELPNNNILLKDDLQILDEDVSVVIKLQNK